MTDQLKPSLFDNRGHDGHLASNGVDREFIRLFMIRCQWLENGCVTYTGGKTVRLPRYHSGVRFTTPRRAAFFIDNARLPDNEVKASCGTPECILPAHIVQSRSRRTEPFVVTRALLHQVLSDRQKSHRWIARKYGIDRKLVKRILDLGLDFPLPEKGSKGKKFLSIGF
jgi:hypothetical protein